MTCGFVLFLRIGEITKDTASALTSSRAMEVPLWNSFTLLDAGGLPTFLSPVSLCMSYLRTTFNSHPINSQQCCFCRISATLETRVEGCLRTHHAFALVSELLFSMKSQRSTKFQRLCISSRRGEDVMTRISMANASFRLSVHDDDVQKGSFCLREMRPITTALKSGLDSIYPHPRLTNAHTIGLLLGPKDHTRRVNDFASAAA